MKGYHFFEVVARGKETAAIGNCRGHPPVVAQRFRTYALRQTIPSPNLKNDS